MNDLYFTQKGGTIQPNLKCKNITPQPRILLLGNLYYLLQYERSIL
jgi:hypothetical protein